MRLQRPPTAAVRKIRLLCVHTPAARGVKRLLQPALDAHATMVLPSSEGEDRVTEVDDAEEALELFDDEFDRARNEIWGSGLDKRFVFSHGFGFEEETAPVFLSAA